MKRKKLRRFCCKAATPAAATALHAASAHTLRAEQFNLTVVFRFINQNRSPPTKGPILTFLKDFCLLLRSSSEGKRAGLTRFGSRLNCSVASRGIESQSSAQSPPPPSDCRRSSITSESIIFIQKACQKRYCIQIDDNSDIQGAVCTACFAMQDYCIQNCLAILRRLSLSVCNSFRRFLPTCIPK